ncbi:MAG: hypothetical protein M0Z94_04210 [Dehalococcoidales bacterium]|nr:hypothetical protein [Dehalococcoidales bacterium]
MTNTLHRQGTRESLSRDYIIFLHPAKGINREGSGEKVRRFLRLALEEGPVNVGTAGKNMYTVASVEDLVNSITDEATTVAATFSDPEALRRLVGKLKEADLGISVNISGLADEVDEILRSQGIVRHSIEHSLGILGRTERLPTRQILELTTMCGHGMISHNHARKMIDWVKMGKLTPRQAARYLARPCVCGAFNVDRAEELLAKAVEMA